MSLLIGFLPGVGSPGLSLYLHPCLSLFRPRHPLSVYSLSTTSPATFLRILRTSRLPQVLYLLRLATLVSAWRAHIHVHAQIYTRARRSRIGRRCDSRNGRGFPSLFGAIPLLGVYIVCMCSTAAPARETPTGRHCLSWNSAPLPSRSTLSLSLSHSGHKPLLIYLLNNTTATLCRSPLFPLFPEFCFSSLPLNGVYYPAHFSRRRRVGPLLFYQRR